MTFPVPVSLSVCVHISGNRTATYLQQSLGNLMINLNLKSWCFKMLHLGRKGNPSRGFCIFPSFCSSSIIRLLSVAAANAENLGQLTGFPLAPFAKVPLINGIFVSIKR